MPKSITISFKGQVSGLLASTKAATASIGKLGAGVVNFGKALGSALTGNFGPLMKQATGLLGTFASMLFVIPGFLLALVNPMNVVNIAMTNFSAAISASSPEAFLAATRNMAPAMKDAVMSVRLLEPELKNLYGIVEQGFWSGFSNDVTQLSATYFPILDSGLGGIGTMLGNLREDLVQFLLQPQVVSAINAWMTSFAGLGKTLGPLIENMMPAMLSMFTSFANILISLLPLVSVFAGWMADIMNFMAPVISGIGSIISGIGGVAGGTTTGGSGTSGSGSSGGSSGGGIGGFFGGLISGIGSFFSGLFGLAGGGTAMPGHSYLVGERGPEVMQMGSHAGRATPVTGGHTFVTVKIGEQELRGMISSEIQNSHQDVALAARMGRGGYI